MSKVAAKIKEEFLAMIPPTVFFFVALHIVAIVRLLMLKGTGLAPLSTVFHCSSGPHLGKSVLIADLLPLINRFPEKPLICNIGWKTAIYLLMST